MTEIKIPAIDVERGDRLVSFGWVVDGMEIHDDRGYVSLWGHGTRPGKCGTAFPLDLEITVDRPDPVEPPVSRAALTALVEQWEQAAERARDDANNSGVSLVVRARRGGEAYQLRTNAAELRALLGLTAATAEGGDQS